MVPREGFEPTRAYAHYALNVARLPFRHLGMVNPGAKLSPSQTGQIDLVGDGGFEPSTSYV